MIILLVGGHVRGRVLCGGDVVRGLQVARDGVGVPDHVLVADLTRVLHVLVHGDAQPRGGAGLRGRDSRRHVLLVILVQTQVVAADVALDNVIFLDRHVKKYFVIYLQKYFYLYWTLVKEDLFPADAALVELFPEEVSRRAPHLIEELGGGDAVGGAHVTVEPPLLREDGLAADEPALVAPRLLRLDLVRARGLLRGL